MEELETNREDLIFYLVKSFFYVYNQLYKYRQQLNRLVKHDSALIHSYVFYIRAGGRQ